MLLSTRTVAGAILLIVISLGLAFVWARFNRQQADELTGVRFADGRAVQLSGNLRDFYDALRAGDIAGIKAQVAADKSLLTARFGPETALHVAARCDRSEVVALLLDLGGDRDARGQWDGTPLHWACWWGSKETAKMLIDRGALIEDKKDVFGSSPLLWACHGSSNLRNLNGDYPGLVELLIARGAQPDTTNALGIPAAAMASPDVRDVLKKHGVKIPEPATQPAPPSRLPGEPVV